jgi:hypothetical protein
MNYINFTVNYIIESIESGVEDTQNSYSLVD